MDQPITPTPPVFTQTPVEPEPTKKSFPWLIVIVIIFLLAGSSVLAYKYYQLKQQITQIPASSIPTPLSTETPLPSADPTANWKTYIDSECGFEIKYPLEWQAEKDCVKGLGKELPVINCLKSLDFKGYLGVPSNNIEQGAAITMGCGKGFGEKSVQSMINECLEDKKKFPEEKYVCKLFEGQYENFAEIRPNEYFLDNKIFYTIIIEPSSQTPPSVAKQILSTFKFTGQEMGYCSPSYTVEKDTPELTASQNYASECLSKKNKDDCLAIDIYNKIADDFTSPDGIPDCLWTNQ